MAEVNNILLISPVIICEHFSEILVA